MRLEDEKDPNILRQAAILLERENKRLVEQIVALTRKLNTLTGGDAEQLRLRLEELEKQLAVRNRMLFGDSSERREGDEQPETPAPPSTKKPPKKGHGPKSQPSLPMVEVVHELDEADKVCNSCGGNLEAWEGQTEDSEEVDVVTRRFVIKKHKRQKYRCRCGGCVETAPGPQKLFEGARYSVDFAIEVAVEKYVDHMPLERQVRKMRREGLLVESQTLWDQLERVARLLAPGHEALLRYILSQPVIGADETRWPLLGKGNDKARWHAWSITARDAVAYRILEGRSAKEARQVLGNYEGVVVCDGYGAYKSLAAEKGQGSKIKLAHCWAHARREFIEAEKAYPQETKEMLGLIRDLYAIEARCVPGQEGDAERLALRTKESAKIVERIRDYLEKTAVVPGSSIDSAIKYVVGHWSGLTRFLTDPRIQIDNNHTERAERGVVVGRKNHYGSRSKRGTEVAALFYSYVESAKLCELDPREYLRASVMSALRGERIELPHEAAARR